MRTTVNLDDDIVEAAKSLARAEGRSLGEVLSELVRRALEPRPELLGDEGGFPVFSVPPGTPVVTNEMVRAALDEE